jgi:hypothetical protein
MKSKLSTEPRDVISQKTVIVTCVISEIQYEFSVVLHVILNFM